jgi:hypothetical protein
MSTVNEDDPNTSSPERPPQTPCDPPDPAPQADAWRRALKVVTAETARRFVEVPKTRMGRNLARRH